MASLSFGVSNSVVPGNHSVLEDNMDVEVLQPIEQNNGPFLLNPFRDLPPLITPTRPLIETEFKLLRIACIITPLIATALTIGTIYLYVMNVTPDGYTSDTCKTGCRVAMVGLPLSTLLFYVTSGVCLYEFLRSFPGPAEPDFLGVFNGDSDIERETASDSESL